MSTFWRGAVIWYERFSVPVTPADLASAIAAN